MPATGTISSRTPGSFTVTCHFSLSPDKKQFREKCVAEAADGKKSDQYIVYDRTQ